MTPLVCTRCGAPLPASTGPFVTCGFCDATHRLDGGRAQVAEERPAVVVDHSERRLRFVESLKRGLGAGRSPYEALCVAAREELGPLGETDGLARITLALAADFDREHGTTVTTDPLALSRVAEAYHLACGRLATAPRTELNLPFLQATSAGPVHLLREVTPAELAELAARDPASPKRAAAAAPGAPPPRKRGWWPFG